MTLFDEVQDLQNPSMVLDTLFCEEEDFEDEFEEKEEEEEKLLMTVLANGGASDRGRRRFLRLNLRSRNINMSG
ncbi:hypothetical protein F8388_010185 [Cannabis sativa]|uniref:Uncharacterized protein n=1 Tax=Cannabis sativa TaxID=3483 RepID=A0A7J6GU88_CANSA|nr:hypothetical protein F8388_010185 [Cannabis sativa]